MMMRYYPSLGVGHAYAHDQISSNTTEGMVVEDEEELEIDPNVTEFDSDDDGSFSGGDDEFEDV